MRKKLILCWFIVHEFPDAGINELIESVRDIGEFYSIREKEGPPLLPITWKTKVRPGKTYIRPVFPIVEDED